MNQSFLDEFILVGFNVHSNWGFSLFTVFILIYIMTVFANILIIILVYTCKNLHVPMYIFLSNLSLCDIMFTTNIVPKMLSIILKEGAPISVKACISQFLFYGSLGSTECFLLSAMSYDRYLAICKPLNYNTIMNFNLQEVLIIVSWVSSFIVSLVPYFLLKQLKFCGPKEIDHFFCDLAPILELSCTDTTIVKIETLMSSFFVVILPFLFVCSTYVHIILTILKIKTTRGRQKTFSTCSSHLVMVCAYFITIITVYSIPSKASSSNASKIRSLVYIVLIPLFNPIVYSLRNNEIKKALYQILSTMQGMKN